MDANRKAALIAGVLFVIADVAGVPSLAISQPLRDAPDYLIKFSANANQVTMAALLVFIMAAACASIVISMYPVLRRFNVGLALGSVGFRTIEGVFGIAGAISLLLLVTLSQEFVKAGAPDASHFQTLGTLLLAAHDWVSNVAMILAWNIGALMYNYLFYQSKLLSNAARCGPLTAGWMWATCSRVDVCHSQSDGCVPPVVGSSGPLVAKRWTTRRVRQGG